MPNIIMVNPSSGDASASLFTGPDASDEVLTSVPKGTMLKVIGSSGNFYNVEYDDGAENITHGGTANTGTIISYPYAPVYDDSKKSNHVANINTGTACEIIDDTIKSLIKIKALTTEGWKEGYVEAKYIHRDKEETPVLFKRPTRSITSGGEATSGVVTARSGLNTRTGPSTSYTRLGAFNYGASLTIHETKSGWYRVTGTAGWGDLSNVWVCGSYVRVTGTNSSASIPKTDTTPVSKPKTSDGDDWEAYSSKFSESNLNNTVNDEYYKQLSAKYTNALGAPSRYTKEIDIRYEDTLSTYGRAMSKTILSNPSIISICPGKVSMFPNLIGSERDSVVESMLSAATGNSKLIDKIKEDAPGRFSGRLYKFEADTAEYAKYLNALCRASAIMLGIGDEIMPETEIKLKHYDYAYWTIRKKYDPYSAESKSQDGSIFRKFVNSLVKTAKTLKTAAVDDTCYINFFLNGSETSISESITNNVSDSPLSGVMNTVSSVSAQINYFTGSGFDIDDSSANEALDAVLGSGDSVIGGLKNIAENFVKGGRMVLPKMVDGSQYGRSISCNMKFVSPYGNKLSVFLKCLVPICHLIAMAFPRQLSDNMYTYPFLVRCAQTGHFNVDLGIISSLTINRGGSDETSWTIDTLATEWEVTMEITPLVDQLMISSTSHPVLMCKNEMLLDYLGNFCGFDVYANNLGTKYDLMMAFILAKFAGVPHSIENKICDTLYNKLNKFFRLSW